MLVFVTIFSGVAAVVALVFLIRQGRRQGTILVNVSASSGQTSMNEQPVDTYIDNYWFPVELTKRKVSARLKLKYGDTSNIVSERVFDVAAFSRGEKGYHIHGYCHKKQQNITLSSLGIVKAIDDENNDPIENVGVFLEERYRTSPESKKDLLFDDYGWAIYPLVYLAATSGSVVRQEREIIISFIKSLPQFSCLENDWIDKSIRELYRPGKMEIRNWVKAALAKGADFSIIADPIAKLSELQKGGNREFASFYRYIEKQMKQLNPKTT